MTRCPQHFFFEQVKVHLQKRSEIFKSVKVGGNPKIENAYKSAGSSRLNAPHFSKISDLMEICRIFNVQIHEALKLNDLYVTLAIANNILKNGIDAKAQEILNK